MYLYKYGEATSPAAKTPVMKKHTAYLVLSALLLAAGLLALIGSFAVYFRPGLIINPVLTVGQSLALFAVATALLYGQRRAFETANARRMAYQYVRR